eukprot:2590812-Amphidinium_carterae.1
MKALRQAFSEFLGACPSFCCTTSRELGFNKNLILQALHAQSSSTRKTLANCGESLQDQALET